MDADLRDKLRHLGIEFDRPSNVNLASTVITPEIRVSSAVIYSSAHFGAYWQVETWCFSSDPFQRSFQRIHGTHLVFEHEAPDGSMLKEWKVILPSQLRLVNEAQLVHSYIVGNLRRKFNVD